MIAGTILHSEGRMAMTVAISLRDGGSLPATGFGFWKVDPSEAADVCQTVIRTGYRHLDCACDYGNEAEVGAGISAAACCPQ